jgi:Zn finger protein HypA/HybF involved in hydrogenase expression
MNNHKHTTSYIDDEFHISDITLMNCPFCDEVAEIFRPDNACDDIGVRCTSCDAEIIRHNNDLIHAIIDWNTRVMDTDSAYIILSDTNGDMICDNCYTPIDYFDSHIMRPYYCPHCGAKLLEIEPLKYCPFCNKRPTLTLNIENKDDIYYKISCCNPDCIANPSTTKHYHCIDDAINDWNSSLSND